MSLLLFGVSEANFTVIASSRVC